MSLELEQKTLKSIARLIVILGYNSQDTFRYYSSKDFDIRKSYFNLTDNCLDITFNYTSEDCTINEHINYIINDTYEGNILNNISYDHYKDIIFSRIQLKLSGNKLIFKSKIIPNIDQAYNDLYEENFNLTHYVVTLDKNLNIIILDDAINEKIYMGDAVKIDLYDFINKYIISHIRRYNTNKSYAYANANRHRNKSYRFKHLTLHINDMDKNPPKVNTITKVKNLHKLNKYNSNNGKNINLGNNLHKEVDLLLKTATRNYEGKIIPEDINFYHK